MTVARLAELHPEPLAEFDRVCAVADEVADTALLALCMDRVRSMLDRSLEWSEPADLGQRERAYLEFTEQFVVSVSTVSDEQVEALLAHDSAEDVYAFIGSLYAYEMRQRLELVSSRVLG